MGEAGDEGRREGQHVEVKETEGREQRWIDVLMNRLCVDLSAIYSLIRKYLGVMFYLGDTLRHKHHTSTPASIK